VNNRITVTEQNLYWVQISAYCGSSRDSVDLQLLFSPTPEIGDDRTFCGNMKSFNLVAGNGDNEEIYLWSDGSTGSSFEVKSPGQYWVQVQNKCGNAADSLSVRISEYPIVNLGKDTTLCGNFKLLLDAGNSGMSYLWEPGGETSQSIVASEQKLYRVFVSNVDGCTSADELEIRPDCISHIHIPTAFSPNHDNINDTYKPVLVNFENYTLQIYDRWGELLFETHDINQGWDGTFLGRDVQQGVYLYQITFTTTEDLLPGNYSGLLHLIR
jgi:gliding motility-associated-like protein